MSTSMLGKDASDVQSHSPPLLSKSELAKLPTSERFVRELAQSLDRKRSKEGKFLYFVTLTYAESKEFPITLNAANRHLKCFHSKLIGYLAGTHNYHRSWFRAIEPEFHAFVDVPGSKVKTVKKTYLPTRESTFHHHIILVAHERHRKKLDDLCASDNDDQLPSQFGSDWLARTCRVRSLLVVPMTPTLEDSVRVVDYASAYARRAFGKLEWEDMYLPFPIR